MHLNVLEKQIEHYNAISKNPIKYTRIDGTVPMTKRLDIYKDFGNLKNNIDVLLITLQCGAVGLNLAMANHVIIADPWWNRYVTND